MSIGKAKRKFLDDEKAILPGVGAYNVLHSEFNATRGRSFTRASRSVTQTNNLTDTQHSSYLLKPGPGSYSVDLRRVERHMSFTHSKRFRSSNNKIPGPGFYRSQECSKQKIKAGIICRSARKTIQLRQKIPGPCDYSQPQIILYKKKDPTALFGKAKRNLEAQHFESTNLSRDNLRKQLMESGHEASAHKNRIQFEKNWQGKKLEKQAKVVQKDEVHNLA